jgi:hypothetical protein
LEAVQDFADVFRMARGIGGVYKDVIQIDDDANVEEIGENVVHKPLKSGWRIRESHRHYLVLKGAIARPEGCLPLFSSRDTDEVVSYTEIEFCESFCGAKAVKEVWNQGKRVAILSSDAIKPSVVDAKT